MASDGREVRHAFHQIYGADITLSHGNTVAEKDDFGASWTVFSRDPVEVSETFTVKLTDYISVSNDVQMYMYCMITLLSVIDIDIVNVNTYMVGYIYYCRYCFTWHTIVVLTSG